MSSGVGEWSALFPRPLYRGPVAKRVALAAGHASLRSVKKILSHIESPTWLCPLFPSARVLRVYFFRFSHPVLLFCAPSPPGRGGLPGPSSSTGNHFGGQPCTRPATRALIVSRVVGSVCLTRVSRSSQMFSMGSDSGEYGGRLGIRAPEVRVSPLRQIAVQTRLSVMEDSLRAPRPARVMFPIYAAALSILSGRACLWQTNTHLS